MPRYLRYIASASVAVTVYFILALALGVTLVGTGDDPKPVSGAAGLLIALLGQLGPVVGALLVNDWLKDRYPPVRRSSARAQEPTAGSSR